MAHIWWTCPRVRRLWIRIYALLRNIFQVTLKKDPYEALLCKPIPDLTRAQRQLAQHLFTATKLTIARSWKTPLLSFEAAKNRMNDILVNEKFTAIVSDSHAKFLKAWDPWISNVAPSRFQTTLLSL